jgi:hypothetical protein
MYGITQCNKASLPLELYWESTGEGYGNLHLWGHYPHLKQLAMGDVQVDKYILYHDLRDAVQHDHCPVCQLVERRVARTIKVLLREGAGDGVLVKSFANAKGYCNAHAWQVREAGDPASQAAFYRVLLEGHKACLERYLAVSRRSGIEKKAPQAGLQRFRSLLQQTGSGRERASDDTRRFLDSFASEERCPICVVTESCERRYVEAVAEYYEGDEEFRERYRNRGVLCSPHFRRLIQEHTQREATPELMEIQLSRLDLQIEHLRDIERNANVRYSEEESQAYKGGWIRAVRLDVGLPGTDTAYKQRSGVVQGSFIKP